MTFEIVGPSENVTDHGGVPVSATESGVEVPEQIVASPVRFPNGALATGMSLPLEDGQSAFETVTPRWSVPTPPAVYVIAFVPAPAVMAPFVIDQEYVAPAPASGTDAVFPVVDAQSADAAEIVEEGTGLTVTVALPDAVPAQLASVTAVME